MGGHLAPREPVLPLFRLGFLKAAAFAYDAFLASLTDASKAACSCFLSLRWLSTLRACKGPIGSQQLSAPELGLQQGRLGRSSST